MTTRIALPFTLGFKMSGSRRPGPPDPLPQTSQVRKNLFGPIDHEENMKFVQDELSKISQADCKRWNFDFQAEKPKEGRYNWEPVSGSVPQAYEMRAMACTHSQPTGASEQPTTTQPIEKQPEKPRLPTVPDQKPTTVPTTATPVTTAVSTAVSTAVTTAVATTVTATTRKRKTQDRGGGTVKKVKLGTPASTATTAATTAATTTATTSTADKRNVKSSQQPSISTYMSIRRRVSSLPKAPKEPPPSLLKKSQSQPSPPSPSS